MKAQHWRQNNVTLIFLGRKEWHRKIRCQYCIKIEPTSLNSTASACSTHKTTLPVLHRYRVLKPSDLHSGILISPTVANNFKDASWWRITYLLCNGLSHFPSRAFFVFQSWNHVLISSPCTAACLHGEQSPGAMIKKKEHP